MVLSTVGRSNENRLHSVIRWWAVCTAYSVLPHVGQGVLFILWRYERKLPWFSRNCENEFGPEGKGATVGDGGYEQFRLGCICGAYIRCVPDFYVSLRMFIFSIISCFCRIRDRTQVI